MSGQDRRVALVTGAARGIGRAIAARLLADGMAVIVADRDGAAETADALGGAAHGITVDVGDEAAVTALIEAVSARHGRLDALVNNAGHGAPARPLEAQAVADWHRVIATNLTGTYLCSRAAAPLLRAGSGAIVNIASTRARQSEPHTEAYAASKGGILALTHALAVSLGPDVRVNAVSPGWIAAAAEHEDLTAEDHARHPAGHVGRPEDVAAMVAYLLSAEAGFVTAQEMIVDGGMTRRMIYAE
ncbi:SDR family oxidoreductase [Arhodomonas aquaeolei]|uniref:SDR family oxidoreductase n=1 Tax=Arhodomonas aquaeolei TaxID=2369 RepID=UPI002168EF67|nr:SDR family oxidoreductase [Arhodomonas aquaeolei]MCS4504240.1 SDR family oxidoreductase [Arhodomonas aquaeolei]